MANMFTIRKFMALGLVGFLSTILFFVLGNYYGFWLGIGGMVIGMLVGILIASKILENPFTQMLEGQGILTGVLDSTGVIRFFVMSLKRPLVEGTLDGIPRSDIFDRSAVWNMAAPMKGGALQQKIGTDGKMRISLELTEEEFNKGRFGMFHYPVLLYNDQIKSLITKDFLGNEEKKLFAEHTLLYGNRKLEELTSQMRDFGRYVVEQLKPKVGVSVPSWLIWVIVIGLLGAAAYYFYPQIFPAAKAVGTGAAGAAQAIGKGVQAPV